MTREDIQNAAEAEFFHDNQESLVGPVALKWITNFAARQVNVALAEAAGSAVAAIRTLRIEEQE